MSLRRLAYLSALAGRRVRRFGRARNGRWSRRTSTLAALTALGLAGCTEVPQDASPSLSPVTLSLSAERLADDDRAAAERAQQAALDEGRVVHWSGSGVLGRIVPRHEWVADGKTCRAFTHVVASEIAVREWRRSACRDDDGVWKVTDPDMQSG